MTKIRSYSPEDRSLAGWVRDVVAFLAPLDYERRHITFRFNTDTLPLDVKTSAPPQSVYVARATLAGDSDISVQGGNAITWLPINGGLRVTAIADLTASTNYDVTLAVWTG